MAGPGVSRGKRCLMDIVESERNHYVKNINIAIDSLDGDNPARSVLKKLSTKMKSLKSV